MKLRPALKTVRHKLEYAAVLLVLAPCALAANNFQNLYQFTRGTDGFGPAAGLVADGNGDLYGTTVNGGTDGCGNGLRTLAW